MNPIKATMQERMEFQREQEWRASGVPPKDIEFSRLCGIDARDVLTLRDYSARGFLFVVRCPKVTARPWHGVLPPKSWATKDKSGTSGVVVVKEGKYGKRVVVKSQMFVSDYDLMSIWRRTAQGYEKEVVSAEGGAAHGKWRVTATQLVQELNRLLVSRIQHGCQDDFESPDNPGVKSHGDHFAAFYDGVAHYLHNPAACGRFYREHRFFWPYRENGQYILPADR